MIKEKKKCRNRHGLYLGAERACPEASKFESFIPLVPLVFELELLNLKLAFHFLAWKPVWHDRLPPKFALRMIGMYPS